jgi:hypothetical protein
MRELPGVSAQTGGGKYDGARGLSESAAASVRGDGAADSVADVSALAGKWVWGHMPESTWTYTGSYEGRLQKLFDRPEAVLRRLEGRRDLLSAGGIVPRRTNHISPTDSNTRRALTHEGTTFAGRPFVLLQPPCAGPVIRSSA